jgi:prolyl oligopeptidase
MPSENGIGKRAAPLVYHEEQGGGHGVSDALQHPDLMAMRLAFLFSKLTPSP